jgi:hypothetical protein
MQVHTRDLGTSSAMKMKIPHLAREAALLACSTLLLGSGPQIAQAAPLYMNCGDAPLCGVLALETGLGPGKYQHDQPAVHGLWPEVDQYGSSQCIRPRSSEAPPKRLYSCYVDGGASSGQQIAFESYEWNKHGVCAGTRDESEFFEQVCALSRGPLAVMTKERNAGTRDLTTFARRVEAAGYDVYAKDERTSQLELSACAGARFVHRRISLHLNFAPLISSDGLHTRFSLQERTPSGSSQSHLTSINGAEERLARKPSLLRHPPHHPPPSPPARSFSVFAMSKAPRAVAMRIAATRAVCAVQSPASVPTRRCSQGTKPALPPCACRAGETSLVCRGVERTIVFVKCTVKPYVYPQNRCH